MRFSEERPPPQYPNPRRAGQRRAWGPASALSSTPAIWEVNALAFCSHWGVDIPQDVCDSCFWNMWVSANLLSSSQEGSFIIEDTLLGASSWFICLNVLGVIFSLPRATVKAKNWTVIACLGKTFILWIFLEWWPLHYSLMVGGLEYTGKVWIFLGALGPLGFPKKASPSESLYTPLLPAWQIDWGEFLYMFSWFLHLQTAQLKISHEANQTKETCHLQGE